jgi:hypothetical protein
VTAVYVEYEAPDSQLASSVKAVIKGPPPGQDYFTMPRHFGGVQLANNYVIGTNDDPIVLRFVRRGLWLGATEAKAASTSTGNPAIMTTATFTDDANILMPYDAAIVCETDPDEADPAIEGYLLFQNAANKLFFEEAEGLSLGANTSSTVVSGSSAGSVARFDSSAATGHQIDDSTVSGLSSAARRYAFFAMVKNNSASTVDWSLQLVIGIASITSLTEYGPTRVIAAGDTSIQAVYLGSFSLRSEVKYIQLNGTRSAAGTSPGDDFDVDYIAAVVLDDNHSIIRIDDSQGGFDATYNIEHRLDSHIAPDVYVTDTATDYSVSYEGDAVLSASSNVVSCLALAASNDGANWVIESDASAEVNLTFTATRTRAYLTPP